MEATATFTRLSPDKRDELIVFMASPAERDLLRRASAERDLTMADLIRAALRREILARE